MEFNMTKCIGCGACVEDCTTGCLAMKDGSPVQIHKICVSCGHCVASCPVGAVTLGAYGEAEIEEYDANAFTVDAGNLLHLMKFRRSVRHYRPEMPDEETMERILEAARYAPTGANVQKKRFILIKNEKDHFIDRTLSVLADATTAMDEKMSKRFRLYKERWKYLDHMRKTTGKDVLFYGAPCVLLTVSTDSTGSTGKLDAGLAAGYAELEAYASGLGCCYIGFFGIACSFDPTLRQEIGLKEGERLVSTMVLGYPDHRYYRTVPRRKAQVTVL